jgi:hypothetical protein
MMFRPPEHMIMFAVPFSFSVRPERQRLSGMHQDPANIKMKRPYATGVAH